MDDERPASELRPVAVRIAAPRVRRQVRARAPAPISVRPPRPSFEQSALLLLRHTLSCQHFQPSAERLLAVFFRGLLEDSALFRREAETELRMALDFLHSGYILT